MEMPLSVPAPDDRLEVCLGGRHGGAGDHFCCGGGNGGCFVLLSELDGLICTEYLAHNKRKDQVSCGF